MNNSTNGLLGRYTTPYVHLRDLKKTEQKCWFNILFDNIKMHFLIKSTPIKNSQYSRN